MILPEPAKCRECGRDILWIVNENEKREPFDAKATRVLIDDTPVGEEWYVRSGHLNHFLTCPEAAQFRKVKESGK